MVYRKWKNAVTLEKCAFSSSSGFPVHCCSHMTWYATYLDVSVLQPIASLSLRKNQLPESQGTYFSHYHLLQPTVSLLVRDTSRRIQVETIQQASFFYCWVITGIQKLFYHPCTLVRSVSLRSWRRQGSECYCWCWCSLDDTSGWQSLQVACRLPLRKTFHSRCFSLISVAVWMWTPQVQ